MSRQFCKVGSVKTGIESTSGLTDLEKIYLGFLEEAYNITYTDSSLSDILYHEASKIKKRILNLKNHLG